MKPWKICLLPQSLNPMFKNIKTITFLTITEEMRSRVLASFFLFSVFSLYLGLVLTRLAIEFEARFFRDLSFALLDIFGLAMVLTSTYRVLRQDVGKGSMVELFLVRGLKPWQYLVGRYLGVILTVSLAILMMAVVSLAICLMRNFTLPSIYGVEFILLFLRLLVISCFEFFIALWTHPQANFFLSSLLVYLSAYAAGPLRALAQLPQQQGRLMNFLIKPITYLLPNFDLLSLGDSVDAIVYGVHGYSWGNLGIACGYSFVFCSIALSLACLSFKRPE